MDHDFTETGGFAVECPHCRLTHGEFLTVVNADGSELACRDYTRAERWHIADHIPPERDRVRDCPCGLRAHARVADLSATR